MFIQSEIEKRNLPSLLANAEGNSITDLKEWEVRRKELLQLITEECYGSMDDIPFEMEIKILADSEYALGGKAIYRRAVLNITLDRPVDPAKFGAFGKTQDFISIPVNLTIPKSAEKVPSFVWISIGNLYAAGSFPIEEIIDNGYAVASFYYEDMALDRPNMPAFGMEWSSHTGKKNSCGAIAKWAWAASRVTDYLMTVPELDHDRIVITGASRLGKAAMWAGLTDERYSMIAPFIDGTGGCSLYRQNALEDIDHVIKEFPHWFGGNFLKYEGKVEELPFDAHFLVALCAPRRLYLSLKGQDIYADYKSEFLAAVEASKVYELYGMKGLIAEDRYPEVGEIISDGEIGMHVIPGFHSVGRRDWQLLIEYRNRYGV